MEQKNFAQNKPTVSGAFSKAALEYRKLNLSIIPTGIGHNDLTGKATSIKWARFQSDLPSNRVIASWIDKYPSANIALITGALSGVTVIDCDDTNVSVEELVQFYGQSKLIVKSPRGSYHLYYKYSGEKSGKLQDFQGEFRGDGGYIILPPSYNFKTIKKYEIVKGTIDDIKNLTPITRGQNYIREGNRNNALFNHLRSIASSCKDIETLLEQALLFNNKSFGDNKLPAIEIEKTVKSVWQYKERGELYSNSNQFIKVNLTYARSFMFNDSKALVVYLDLLGAHWEQSKKCFNIYIQAYSKKLNMDPKTLNKALDTLKKNNVIRVVSSHKKDIGKKGIKPIIYKYEFVN